jgi:sugar phosphate isomerase/epimerase
VRLAFTTLACPGWTLEQAAAAAVEHGYQGLELRLLDGELLDPRLPASERRRVSRVTGDAGLAICAVDTSLRLVKAGDGFLDDVRAWCELAAEWSAPVVRVFGGEPPEGATPTGALGGAAERLARAAEIAAPLGVRVAVETHDAFSGAGTVAELVADVPRAGSGVLWDTHHPYRMGDSPEAVWELLGDRVVHVHVKDARRRPDGTWALVPLGEGEVPVPAALKLLAARGYAGWVAVEWEKKWHPEIDEPEVALPQHAALLRDWLGTGR